MRAAVCRIAATIGLALAGSAFGQQPPTRTVPETKTPAPVDLGPSTSPTRDKAADAVKTPVGIQREPTAAPVDPHSYQIGPEDILLVRVWREPELSGAVQVRPDGKITMPLIGELQAAGQTPEGLKGQVAERLTEFVNKPEVMVQVQSVQSRRYYITGEVNRSGGFPLVVPTTILEALTNAGGFREFANTRKITILRDKKIIKFNYNEVIKGKNLQQNIPVENGDYIIVR